MKVPTNTTEETRRSPMNFLEAAMVMGSSGAIEHQEKRGQTEFANSDTLPSKMDEKCRAALEGAGFKFLGPVEGDALFQYVEMATGWKKVPTDHSMWSDLVDDKGRKRGRIFYKAAFYDRDAHIGMKCRFQIQQDYDRKDKENVAVASVFDRGAGSAEVKVFETEPLSLPIGGDQESLLEGYRMADEALAAAKKWLHENYPNSYDPSAYWD